MVLAGLQRQPTDLQQIKADKEKEGTTAMGPGPARVEPQVLHKSIQDFI